MTKRVSQGDYVASGAVLFDIANLSNVWAMFDAFEVDLPFLNRGDQVHFTLQALPGKTYTGRIAFIDPIINPSSTCPCGSSQQPDGAKTGNVYDRRGQCPPSRL